MTQKKSPLVGAHISTAGGIHLAVERALEIGATTMQVFTKNNKQWHATPLNPEEVTLFKKAVKENDLEGITAHAGYLINIGSSNPEVEEKSIKSLTLELARCNTLSIPYLVLHPGSHTGAGDEAGMHKIAKNLDAILATSTGPTKILLETMAGQGTNLGSTFEQIKKIMSMVAHHSKLGVCLDTCHVFAAGYQLATKKDYEIMMQQFDDIVGIEDLLAIHVNDSKFGCGAKKDRHEELGKGQIPLEIFKCLMQDSTLASVPKILETPTPELYAQEITMLKKMFSQDAGN